MLSRVWSRRGGSARRHRLVRRLTAGGGLASLIAVLAAAPAAALPIHDLTATLSTSQAGAHADLQINIGISPDGVQLPGRMRNLEIQLPPGLVGDPQALPMCTQTELIANSCPDAAQVGAGVLPMAGLPFSYTMQLYNLRPTASEPARIGVVLHDPGPGRFPNVPAVVAVRTGGDYGLTTTLTDIMSAAPFAAMNLTLWGVPADHNGSGADRQPYLANPTNCAATPSITIRANSWQSSAYDSATASLGAITGCDAVPFDAQIHTQTGTRAADSAGAFTVDVINPQNRDPDGLAAAQLKNATVRLPEGVAINPATAFDTVACVNGDFGKNNAGPSRCHPGSKVGTVGITTPLLANPIPGDIYLGEPMPGNPYRVFVYAEGSGVRIKLEGSIHADPNTGQLTAVFDDNPPLPFSVFRLNFRGGGRSVLAMPPTCGAKNTVAGLASWSGALKQSVSQFLILADDQGTPCPEQMPFAPYFSAGSTNGNGGQDTGFTLTFGRKDGEQTLKSLKASLPAGLLGRLPSLVMCSTEQAAAAACGDESLAGGVTVSSGAGSQPLNLAGKVWLAEPRDPGEVASLAIFVPAAAGPYNLGNVVVHTGLKVRPDGGLDIASDPLPTIMEGVPLRIRQVIVDISRQGFMFNPTNCAPGDVTGAITSTDGTEYGVSSPFGLNNCANLGFAPKMTLKSGQPAKSGGTAGLNVRIEPKAGDANMRIVQLTLPVGLSARLDGPVQSPCTEEQFAKNECPEASRVGHASAATPALADPVTSNVWFLENKGGTLPKLAMHLSGRGVDIPLIGDIELTSSGRVKTTFGTIPDVPLTSFELALDGDSHSPLSAKSLCGKALKADLLMTGQNGRQIRQTPRLGVSGCKAKAASKSKHKHKAKKHKKAHKRHTRRA